MRLRDAVRRAVGYHLRALPPTLAGVGIAGAGVWYGLGAGTSAAALTASGRLAPAAGLVVAGAAVAAVGRTAVRIDATAAAVSDRVADGGGLDEDDLRETVAIATERAVADSFDGATADIEARVAEAVEGASGSTPSRDAGGSSGDAVSRSGALDALAESPPPEADALADATRRASERVESYLDEEDADVGEFRQLAEGAAVLDDGGADGGSDSDSDSAAHADVPIDADAPADALSPTDAPTERSDGAEILDGDASDRDSAADGDPLGDADDAVIIDGDGENEMVFGDDVRDPESDAE